MGQLLSDPTAADYAYGFDRLSRWRDKTPNLMKIARAPDDKHPIFGVHYRAASGNLNLMAPIEGYQEAVRQRTLSQFTTDDRRACIDSYAQHENPAVCEVVDVSCAGNTKRRMISWAARDSGFMTRSIPKR